MGVAKDRLARAILSGPSRQPWALRFEIGVPFSHGNLPAPAGLRTKAREDNGVRPRTLVHLIMLII